jgi:hypothetical protein
VKNASSAHRLQVDDVSVELPECIVRLLHLKGLIVDRKRLAHHIRPCAEALYVRDDERGGGGGLATCVQVACTGLCRRDGADAPIGSRWAGGW